MRGRGPSASDVEIGRRIRMRRLDLGISQSQLGNALGVTFQQIQKYEKGTNRVGAGRVQEIARILKVSTSFFFDESLGGSGDGREIFSFLHTSYALRLLKAYTLIENIKVKRAAVELIEQIAEIDRSGRLRKR